MTSTAQTLSERSKRIAKGHTVIESLRVAREKQENLMNMLRAVELREADMGNACRVRNETNDHYNESEAALTYEEQNLKAMQLADKKKVVYGSPDLIFESIGIDGIQYPAHIANIADKDERSIEEANYDDDLALQMAAAIDDNDAAMLGSLIIENARTHLNKYIQD